MRVISVVFESCLYSDTDGLEFAGFKKYHLDTYPSTFSARSLWLMQCAEPLPDMDDCHSETKAKVFHFPGKFTSNFAKTRLVSIYWPARYDPTVFDPLVQADQGWGVPEPDCSHWKRMLSFLGGEFYQSDYKWLIYWSLAGHAECGTCRVPEENNGIPTDIRRTVARFANLVRAEILPLVRDDTLVLMHNDHGSSRQGQNYWNRGVIWLPDRPGLPPPGYVVTWADIRTTVKAATGVTQLPDTGRLLCEL